MANKSGAAERSGADVAEPTAVEPCAIEQWTSGIGLVDVFRFLVLMWIGPAAALFVASTNALRNQSLSAEFHNAMLFSRSLFATLAVFTLLVGLMWLVRSGAGLPSFRALGDGPVGWRLHVAAVGVCVLLAPFTLGDGTTSGSLRVVVAVSALVAGSGMVRWLLATALPVCQPLAGFALCVAFEMSVGWLTVDPASGFGIALVGLATLLRSIVLTACCLGSAYALAVGYWPPAISAGDGLVGRITSVD